MKRAGSLKAALSALCRALSALGSLWDPEIFRKSKFNRPEATFEFWELLYCLLKQIYAGKDDSSTSTNEKEIIANQTIGYVKCVLQTQGYGRSAFYDLPQDGNEGSREILLAFSWLLRRVKILEIILEKKRVKVGDHVKMCLCPHDIAFKDDTSPFTKREVDVRYLQWLNGKLQFCWRTLYAAHLEESAILYKIHSCTQGCHIDQNTSHLSAMETELVQLPESCNTFLQSMVAENSCLEAYFEWKHQESVYWRWMETVMESALEDEQGISTRNMNKIYTFSPSGFQSRNNLNNIQMLDMYLIEVQDQLHDLASHRKLSWHEQVKKLERDVSEKELCLTMKKIKQEVKKKIEHLKCHSAEAKDLHGSFRIIFKESKFQKDAVHKDFYTRDIHANEAITFLRRAASKMETEYENLQDQCRKRLDDMTEKLEGVICMPPTKC